MMTIISLVTLKQGSEPEWDAAMRERFAAVKSVSGWKGGQICMPADSLDQRLIVGRWETRAHWEAWHGDAAFAETRERLEGLQDEPADVRWHQVILDESPEQP